jgi:hypothetical protein
MAKLRKYLVFWILVLGVFAPFAAPIGSWAKSSLAHSLPSGSIPAQAGNAVVEADEELAIGIESQFAMVDVVNVAHVGNGAGEVVFVIQMGIERPVEDGVYEAILVKALQGLDSLKTGEEKYYWVELLYGNWLVGRLECNAGPYDAEAISSDNCEYNDVNPAAYLGDMVRWPGRIATDPLYQTQ